jgi:hypothetical protein
LNNINKFKNPSGNEKIDNFIQEIRLLSKHIDDKVFEWIPYDQFKNIKEIGKGGFATIYSAIWNDGPLEYNECDEWGRIGDYEVALKCLSNSQNMTDNFLNEV